MQTNAIQTTVVGSYPTPGWLTASPSEQALRDAISVVFHTQQRAGIDLPVDGELYRFDRNHPETNGMLDYFVRPLSGVRTEVTRSEAAAFAAAAGMQFRSRPLGVVVGPLAEGTLNIPADYQRSRGLVDGPMKFTITSPYMLAKTLLDRHYGSLEALTLAIADILADQVRSIDAEVVQIDEANLTGAPEDGPWVAGILNRILSAVPGKAALHLCFGNYGGQSIQRGHWSRLLDFLNSLQVDHVVLEMAFRGHEELNHFRDLRPEIGLGLGVIDVKRTVIESPDEVARALEGAERIVGAGRITYVHPDCGFWMLQRSIADGKIAALVRGRDLYLGRRPAAELPGSSEAR